MAAKLVPRHFEGGNGFQNRILLGKNVEHRDPIESSAFNLATGLREGLGTSHFEVFKSCEWVALVPQKGCFVHMSVGADVEPVMARCSFRSTQTQRTL